MSVVRVLCFVAVLHCMSASVLHHDFQKLGGPCPAAQDPCLNGGICTVTGSVTSCACVGGFNGLFCDAGPTPAPTAPPTGTTFRCTFEYGADPCFLSQETLDTFDWTFSKNVAASYRYGTGPNSASEGTSYAFIYASTSTPRSHGADAILISSILPMEDLCLTFDYHMYGYHMGSLSVLINDVSSAALNPTMRVLWTKSGDKGDIWHNAVIQIPATPSLRVSFEGIVGGFTSDAAIDNVVLGPGYCGCSPSPCQNGGTCSEDALGQISCTCIPDFTGGLCETLGGSLHCSFEDCAHCFLHQDQHDDFDWSIISGSSTPCLDTGPSSAFEGNKYAFIEATGPRIQYEIAEFYVDLGTNSAQRCLSFAYHMYGSDIGILKISHLDGQQVMTLWSRAGKQGNHWETASVQIPAMNNGQIYITGVRGDGWSGDIAIDDVELKTGTCGCSAMPCRNGGTCTNDNAVGFVCTCVAGFTGVMCESPDGSIPVTCTFEDGASCFLEQVKPKVDTFDWTIKQGYSSSTPSPGSWYDDTWPFPIHDTGPSSAFEGNKYAFIEATGPRIQYEIAEFYVDLGTNSAQCCLSFAYHMYGSDIGSLEISHLDGQQVMTLWSRAGNQGNNWETASVRIPAMNNGQIYITGVRGDGSSGDIAIDDVELKTGTCGSVPGTCTFEDGAYCFLEQVNAAVDSFDWTINQGGTPSSNTGPDNAHTGSKYAFIEASSPRISGDNAILSSEQTTFLPMNRCLQFYFHMKGNSIGDLIVLSGERGSETTVWSLSGAQGNDWVYTEVSLPTAADLVIAIEGVRGSDWRGDIAIDDLELNAGLC
ncbi:hypothetical protein KP79_PYT23719 [Mizuhopecten yessoensis]|uniref:MAM and LDL-receptor class A domain-containing protein 1 n=1 Tax=Mizuhopecten yessoensis TaxID=6573 RepID=A0A210QSH3_MIZYE|nr:hypothetical protein KP79_PYT23719 [Mizuhopecten yessoensis]